MMTGAVLVTLGDPNGIGPELVCAVARDEGSPSRAIVCIGPEAALNHHAQALGLDPFWASVDSLDKLSSLDAGYYLHEPRELASITLTPGRPTPEGGRAAGVALDIAATAMLEAKAGALVTCPLNKAMLQEAGYDFPGHTEFLAERSGVGREGICMHLCGPDLRVSLVTTHPALRDVPALVTRERIGVCLELTADFCRRLGLDAPVAVCGLNPHAGESGKIGDEEMTTISPAIEKARSKGLKVEGPYPADTIFSQAAAGRFSAVLAMYHDQGLGPLKLLHFGEAVNVTLGLPFVRTSPDHGTAYDIVGKGIADTGSYCAALELALQL